MFGLVAVLAFSALIAVGCGDGGSSSSGPNKGATGGGGNLVLGSNQAWVACDFGEFLDEILGEGGFDNPLMDDDFCAGFIFKSNGDLIVAMDMLDPMMLQLMAMVFGVPYNNENWLGVPVGKWSVSGDLLTLIDEDGDAETIRYGVSGNTMHLFDDDGTSLAFTRQNGVRVLVLPLDMLDDLFKRPEGGNDARNAQFLVKAVGAKILKNR